MLFAINPFCFALCRLRYPTSFPFLLDCGFFLLRRPGPVDPCVVCFDLAILKSNFLLDLFEFTGIGKKDGPRKRVESEENDRIVIP